MLDFPHNCGTDVPLIFLHIANISESRNEFSFCPLYFFLVDLCLSNDMAPMLVFSILSEV